MSYVFGLAFFFWLRRYSDLNTVSYLYYNVPVSLGLEFFIDTVQQYQNGSRKTSK